MRNGTYWQENLRRIRNIRPSAGGLILGPRPGKKSKAALAQMGLTHVCTLLSRREIPAPIARIALELGCRWLWLPVERGDLETLRTLDAEAMVAQLAEATADLPNSRVYLHCSAGIHRTGFFASLLLRLEKIDTNEIPLALAKLRPVTAEQVGPERIACAIEKAEALLRKE